MSRLLLRVISRVLILASLYLVVAPAQSQTTTTTNNGNFTIGPDHLGLIVVSVGVVLVAGITLGVYFGVRQPRVTGCVSATPDGKLAIQGNNPGDPLYLLQGETTTLQAGNRVKVIGKRRKDASKQKLLVVSRVAKVYGACSHLPAAQATVALPGGTTETPFAREPGTAQPAMAQ